jgi:hypothetical protein
MKMQEIRQRAKLLGLKLGKKRKADLIRTIQAAEGNFSCFQTGSEACDQSGCCWREDCLAS